MYEYGDNLFASSCAATSNADFLLGNVSEIATSSPPFVSPSLFSNFPAKLTGDLNEFDSVNETLLLAALKSEVIEDDNSNIIINSSTTTTSSVYGSPSPSCYVMQRPSLIQRSLSISDSLLKKNGYLHPNFSSLEEYHQDILNLETGPMRKVFSTGDIQKSGTSQSSRPSESTTSQHENCIGHEGMKKVGRYSAEERKERIERYRSKRNQRNFTKKIKYACRKTLADSRPRIRGRFMRNEEPGESSQTQWMNQMGGGDEDDEFWINFLDALSVNQIP
ncbi:CCT domain [Macleaya cordata]|uniref:CCT domain n=1 Tax=Macleaya cordata TaxID=56857 RepID=A0A200QHM5_MACCD|nr:CCT domain [Macleaya cordata]